MVNDNDKVEISDIWKPAIENIEISTRYGKFWFDSHKTKFTRINVRDHVQIKKEWNQTKTYKKLRGPFLIAETLDGEIYILTIIQQ